MADTPQIPSQQNVATLTSPDIVANLKASQPPQTFGDQLTAAAIAAGTNAALNSTIGRLYKQKADLIKEGIELGIQHQTTLLKYEKQFVIDKKQAGEDPQKLADAEKNYRDAIAIEDINYAAAKKNLEKRKEENQKDIDKYLADPFAKQKEKRKKRKAAREAAKKRTTAEKQAARKQKRKAVLKSATKSLIPVLTLLLTDKIAEVISQNDKIQQLINEANIIIEAANISNDPAKLQNAKIVRDNALTVIQSNEEKINKISKQINLLTPYITFFGIIVNTIAPSLLPVPVPSPAPDVVTPPKETFRTRVYEPALKILNALIALLPTIIVSLEKAISILEELKAQLLPINGELESKSNWDRW